MTKTDAALLPCPFCNAHIDEMDGTASHPHSMDVDCILNGRAWTANYFRHSWNALASNAALDELVYEAAELRGKLAATESKLAEQTEAATRYLARINRLDDACKYYNAALLCLNPRGASREAFENWNTARILQNEEDLK